MGYLLDFARGILLAAAAPLRSRLNGMGLASSLTHVKLRTPALGDDAPLIGAAELASTWRLRSERG